jgi:hypothetical protein
MNISLATEHAGKRVKCNYLLDYSVLYQVLPWHCQLKNGLEDYRIRVVPFDGLVASALPSSEGFFLKMRYFMPNR